MSELHLRNSFVVLIVIVILFLVFLANVIMPSLSEKMICGLHGGHWDKMLSVCAFDPKVCKDAGGIPIIVHEEWNNEEEQKNSSNAAALGCKFE